MPSDTSKRPKTTDKLDLDEHRTLVVPAPGTVDVRFNPQAITYLPVPSCYADIEDAPVWRVLLKFDKRPQRVVAGLDIYGDTVFGRGAYETDSPDIDLTNLDALERGVSRIHALLRPTFHELYLIDLASTNGTFVNAVQLKNGIAQTIHNHDEVAFAGLSFVVEIVAPPSYPIELPPPEPGSGEVEPMPKIAKSRAGTDTIAGVKLEFPPKLDDPDLPQ